MAKRHAWKEWLVAVRPWSFPASAMPVAVTLAYLWWAGEEVNWVNGVWALINIIMFHAAGNTWSDYFDYRRQVDRADTYGVKTLTGGMFEAKEIYGLSLGLLAVAVLMGVGLLLRTGLPLLYIGIGGIFCALFYPTLKYRALGDWVILMSYSLLPILGTTYVALGRIDWSAMWLALPVGLITVAILHINNTRDVPTDRRAGIRTLAMLIGKRASTFLYCFEVIFPFVWIVGCTLAGVFPVWTLLVLLALVMALGNVRHVICFPSGGVKFIAGVDELTAKLQLLFSLLLIVSFILARLCA